MWLDKGFQTAIAVQQACGEIGRTFSIDALVSLDWGACLGGLADHPCAWRSWTHDHRPAPSEGVSGHCSPVRSLEAMLLRNTLSLARQRSGLGRLPLRREVPLLEPRPA